MNTIAKAIYAVLLLMSGLSAMANTIDVTTLGAKGDGITDNTVAIQRAIDQCAKNGGRVYVPAGNYLIRPLQFRSNVNLYLEAGSKLIGSTNLSAYDNAFPIPKGNRNQTSGLIWGIGLSNISISGEGTIDGQGGHQNFQHGNDSEGGPKRPKIIYFVECKKIVVKDITLLNSAYWVQHYEKCEDVMLKGLTVISHCNYNNDGIDIDAKNVVISDCNIDVEDDAICLKSDHESFCENVVISNCLTATNCNAIKLGTASNGGFRNITVTNCTVKQASEDRIRHWSKTLEHITAEKTVISGIAIEMVDGGIIDGVTVSNISMRDVQTPIFIKLGDRKRTFRKDIGILKNINISNCVATAESLITSSITGTENADVENVSVSHFQITHPGGGTAAMTATLVPENQKKYPENRMFGNTLPASGFYVRHVKNIRFDDIRINSVKMDQRPLFVFDDVQGAEVNQSAGQVSIPESFVKALGSHVKVDGKVISP